MLYKLDYVNLSDREVHLGKNFDNVTDLIEFVHSEYALFTSYCIIVIAPDREPA